MSDDKLSQFAGCWNLVSYEFRSADGQVLYPWGEDPVGMAINDGKGHFSAQIMRRDRPKIHPDHSTLEDYKAVYSGYIAYFGTTEVKEGENIRINHVEGSLNPAWVGGEQIRHFELIGNTVTYKIPRTKFNGIEMTGTLTWKRVT